MINHTSPSYHIPIGQGFFVNSKAGGGTLILNESLQSHQTGTDNFRSASTSTPEIKVLAATDKDTKSTLVKYLSNTTRGLDPGFDAGHFDGVAQDLRIYTQLLDQNQGINFALQAVPEDYENQIIPVGLKATSNEEITFTIEAQNLPQDMKVFLEDKETQIITRLDTQGADYTVTLNASEDGTGRFFLHTSSSAVLSNPSFDREEINMYVSQRRLKALGLNPGNYDVEIYNLLGQLIYDQKLDVASDIDLGIPSQIRSGVYIVKINSGAVHFSKKIILE